MSTQTSVSGITFGDGTTQNTASYMAAQNVIYENNKTISANYTMTTNRNGTSAGPITINSGVIVTIPANSRWVVS